MDVSYWCSDITEVVSWLLNEDTEAADVMALGIEFHSGMVLGEKDFWNFVVLRRGIWSLCCVTFPLTGLSFTMISSLTGGTATCSLRILYRKASRLTRQSRLRSSKGSSWSCCSRAVTLVVWSYELVIQRAALLCILSMESLSLDKCGSHTVLAYSIPDRTRDM